MRRALLPIAALAALITPAALANRAPITVSGLQPDTWYFTTSQGEAHLHQRYPGIRTVQCYGIIMQGDVKDSSLLHGLSRYWDKLACEGSTRNGHQFVLICDAKSSKGWIIYRLRDATLSDLQAT